MAITGAGSVYLQATPGISPYSQRTFAAWIKMPPTGTTLNLFMALVAQVSVIRSTCIMLATRYRTFSEAFARARMGPLSTARLRVVQLTVHGILFWPLSITVESPATSRRSRFIRWRFEWDDYRRRPGDGAGR